MSEESRKGPRAINVAAGPWQAWQGQLDDLTVAGPRPEAHAQYNKHALDLRTAAPPLDRKGQVPFANQKMTYYGTEPSYVASYCVQVHVCLVHINCKRIAPLFCL